MMPTRRKVTLEVRRIHAPWWWHLPGRFRLWCWCAHCSRVHITRDPEVKSMAVLQVTSVGLETTGVVNIIVFPVIAFIILGTQLATFVDVGCLEVLDVAIHPSR